jgi:SAM-dependent methyltransferase
VTAKPVGGSHPRPGGARTEESFWDRYWLRNLRLPAEVRRVPGDVYGNSILDVFDRLPNDPSLSIAEIGGAPGQYLAYLHKRRGYAVTCIDYSPIGCQKTRENFELLGIDGSVIQADVFDNEVQMPRFDAVYSMGLIEHFNDPGPIVQRHARLVKPGGYLVLGVPNLQGIHGWFFRRLRPRMYATHVIDTMDLDTWRRFEDDLALRTVYKNYIGGFEPRVFRTRQEIARTNLHWYVLAVWMEVVVHSVLGFVRRFDGPLMSGWAMAVYQVPP